LRLLQGVSGTQQGKVVAAAGQAGLVPAQFIVQQASASGAAHQAAQGKKNLKNGTFQSFKPFSFKVGIIYAEARACGNRVIYFLKLFSLYFFFIWKFHSKLFIIFLLLHREPVAQWQRV
jgi:hypothetical protein